MPDLIIGRNYSYAQIRAAYHADPPGEGEDDTFFALHCGEEIAALCLRHKFHPKPGEVWVGDSAAAVQWGERLAQCQKTVPVYYAPRSRNFYEFLGHHVITGENTDPQELTKRKSPVPLSRIVSLQKVRQAGAAMPR